MACYSNYSKISNLAEAFEQAIAFCRAEPEEINFLFSPACASFDMWPNFMARGDEFKKLYQDLDGKTL